MKVNIVMGYLEWWIRQHTVAFIHHNHFLQDNIFGFLDCNNVMMETQNESIKYSYGTSHDILKNTKQSYM